MTSQRTPFGRAYNLATSVTREIRRAGLAFDDITLVGGLRRFAPDVGDIAILGVAPTARLPRLLEALQRLPVVTSGGVTSVGAASSGSITLNTERGAVTAHLTTPERAGGALLWHTGSRAHLDLLQRCAVERACTFEGGELRQHGTLISTPTETVAYAALGLPFIPPELRHGGDEVQAAQAGALPSLIGDLHIRGDLHMHTTWSDGRDPAEDMAGVARQLGYEYIAITDHSERAGASRVLAASAVAAQREEIEALRRKTHGLQILHGIEVDIMPDGSLDFADDQLEGFDIVLASLHDRAGQDGEALTERCLKAIRHPLVNVITHPANRSPAFLAGYDLDFDRIFAAAADTGTALEIDGAPGHLDMDGALARRAVAAGATLCIDSDAHRAEWLGRQMRFGVGTARRGWVEPSHVLNTRGVDEVRAFLARKRAR